MNVFKIIMSAPFCVVALLLFAFKETFKGLSVKFWGVHLLVAAFTFYAVFLVKAFSGQLMLENSWQSLFIFNLVIILIALSLYHFKKTHQLARVNGVSLLLSVFALISLYRGSSLVLFLNILLAVAILLELGVWIFVVRSKVKMVDSKTDEVLIFPGDVTLAVMLGAFFVLIIMGKLQKSPTDFDYVNGLSAAALCRFLITRVYLCLKTVYGARGN